MCLPIELPAAPTSLSITSDEPDSLVITLDWTQPPASSPNREVDEFVMEVMRNDNPWETQVGQPACHWDIVCLELYSDQCTFICDWFQGKGAFIE